MKRFFKTSTFEPGCEARRKGRRARAGHAALARTDGRVGVITLTRPRQMNALDDTLMGARGAA